VADALKQAPHRRKFAIIYVALSVAAGVAIGAVGVIATRPSPKPPPAFSSWQPVGTDVERVRAIASFVGSEYGLPGGGQLADVRGTPLSANGQSVKLASLVDPAAHTVKILGGDSVEYTICGPMRSCGVPSTTASQAGILTRREALELALYTFRYLPNVDNVVVLRPPISTTKRPPAIVIQRSQVGDKLGRPLVRDLPGSSRTLTPRDAESIGLATDPYLYDLAVGTVGPNRQPALVINPVGFTQPMASSSSSGSSTGP
jgi:hypothetical protein